MQFIGTSQANTRAGEANALGVYDLWTPENHYRWNKSLYGSQVSASVTAVRQSRLFSQSTCSRIIFLCSSDTLLTVSFNMHRWCVQGRLLKSGVAWLKIFHFSGCTLVQRFLMLNWHCWSHFDFMIYRCRCEIKEHAWDPERWLRKRNCTNCGGGSEAWQWHSYSWRRSLYPAQAAGKKVAQGVCVQVV